MAASADDDAHGNGYRDNTARRYDESANTKPAEQWPINRRRHPSAAHTDIPIAKIETTTMTAEEEVEAIQAFAVILARFWRTQHDPMT